MQSPSGFPAPGSNLSSTPATHLPPPRTRHAEAHAWITAGFALALWAQVLWAGAPEVSSGRLTPSLALTLGLATQCVAVLIEAASARMLWFALGLSPGYGALFARILAASAAEAFAVGVLAGSPALPPAAAAFLCGPRAIAGFDAASGVESAFAALGALAVLRMLVSAHGQASLARSSFARGMLVVGALYLSTRLALAWGFDLLQGRSFQGPVGILSWPVMPSLG